MDGLTAALHYASLGLHVAPVAPGEKRPRTPKAFNDATRNEAEIRTWWRRWPDSGVGVGCEPSGLAVLDIDARNNGFSSLESLLSEYGPLPTTWTVETGGGGRHYYFRVPEGTRVPSRNGLRPGIDVKAAGGGVIAPPSRHQSGHEYIWQTLPEGIEGLSDLPPWLLDLIKGPTLPVPSEATAQEIQPGHRNSSLFSLATSLGRFGLQADEIAAVVRSRNASLSVPLPQAEVDGILKSASERRIPTRERFRPLTVDDLRGLPPTDWLVRDLFRGGDYGLLYGLPDSGKTFAACHLALCIATGLTFFGRETAEGAVVYVTEHAQDLGERFAAWEDHYATSIPSDRVIVVDHDFPQLTQETEAAAFTDFLAGFPTRPKLVVVDTLWKAMVGVDYLSPSVMSRLVDNVLSIAKHTGTTFLFVHHSTKGSRDPSKGTPTYNGHVTLEGASSMVARADLRRDGPLVLSMERNKGTAPQPALSAELRPVSGSRVLVEIPGTHAQNASGGMQAAESRDHVESLMRYARMLGAGNTPIKRSELQARFEAGENLKERTFQKTISRALEEGSIQIAPGSTQRALLYVLRTDALSAAA